MRRGYSILTIYEHALKPYIKLPSHMPKYQTHRKEETFSKQIKGTVSQYRQYCTNVLKSLFWAGLCKREDSQIVYVQVTTASQDSLQILQKGTWSSRGKRYYDFPSIDFGKVLGRSTSRPKNITIMNTSNLKIGVEETRTARPCCRGLIIAHFERALGKQQMTKILIIL